MFSGKRIVLGVTGGIAAYKAAVLLRDLQKKGAEVRVMLTADANRFVGIETFASLSGHEVPIDIFPEEGSRSSEWTRHIEWGEWSDLMIIAPCTANTLAKIVYGLSDNMLTATVLAARCPILICPTMDGGMYTSPTTQKNLKQASELGFHLLEPEEGYLASGMLGKGRLPETTAILQKASELLEHRLPGLLKDKKVVVTAGPTREHIDAVRFISNPSSGKMGVAMAEAAQNLGADVTLIHGPVSVGLPPGMKTVSIESTEELFKAVKKHSSAEVIIKAAAVSDFTPAEHHDKKIKKEQAETTLELKPTRDILQWLGDHKQAGQTLIGFAMETESLLENAQAKLKKKKADWIVANSINRPGSGFATDTNEIVLLNERSQTPLKGTKKEVARLILEHIFKK